MTDPTDVRYEDVYAEAKRLAEASPAFVYKGAERKTNPDLNNFTNPVTCQYIDDTTYKGSCLFGQALVNLGFAPSTLTKYEGDSIWQVTHSLLGYTEPNTTEREIVDRLSAIQDAQDNGAPWGAAINANPLVVTYTAGVADDN